jgi:hypothetical protein
MVKWAILHKSPKTNKYMKKSLAEQALCGKIPQAQPQNPFFKNAALSVTSKRKNFLL